ncbi:protogenin isoform X2 [Halyomorpha halys]|uniref:protogenin isoform X2 n=1 Tax=Halyomorpha halys TaxID=286706 RepID=UPI0006D50CEF|nr:protogenin-like isoform X2 [Halyomorpha halys]
MAARVLLIGIASLVGLIAGKTNESETGVRLGAEPPLEAVAIRGRFFSLPCGPPAPGTSIFWFKDGKPIKEDNRISVTTNGSLVFSKVVHKKKGATDSGLYRCLVQNKYGALLSRPSRLIIPVLSHEFRTSPESAEVSEGDVARLTCYIDSTPPASITWLKDSQPLPQNKRFTSFDSGTLYIYNVKQEDAGSYTCEAKNPYVKKTPLSKTGIINVKEGSSTKLAHFLPNSPPSTLTVKVGKVAFLICAVSGLPKPTLSWVHTKQDGNNVTLQTMNYGLNIIKFNKIQVQNSGVYICTATQTAKEKTYIINKKVTVSVETPPQIIEKPKSEVYPAAKTVRIDCEVKGHPLPEVIWYKDGVQLYINGRIKKNPKQLVLGAAVTQDTGVYQCFAGDVWAAARIVVNSRPDQPQPPANLTCIPLSSTQIRLSWTPTQSGVVQAYSVHYFPTEGGEEYKEVAPNNTYTVQKLQPYTNYTFYIRSYGTSASEQSHRVICSTGETVPSGGPLVNVTVTGSQCLLVSWSPPPTTKARGTITSYKVQWKRVNQSSVNFELLPAHINQYRIAGLESGERYMIRVLAATSLGWPEFPDAQAWINVTLPPTSINFPPPSISTSSINLTSLRVDWNYNYPQNIDGFVLTYRKVRGGNEGNISIPANATSHIISGLDSSSWYDISLKAYAGKMYGEDCSVTVLVGGDGSLPPPILTEAAPLSPATIRVSWKPPPHSSVFLYTLELESRGKILRTLVTNKTEVELNDLNGDTVYETRVRAHGYQNKTSSYSIKLECRTPPYVINVVNDVKCQPINSSVVLVTWTPLQVPAVHSYNVFYSRDLAAPINLWHSKSVQVNESSVRLTGLKSNTKYVLTMRGVGTSGPGPLSPNVYFILSSTSDTNLPPEPHQPNANKNSDQFLGILVGCGISIIFIIVCSGSLLYRRRCLKNSAQPSQHEMTALTHLQGTKCQPGGSGRDGREEMSLLNETEMSNLDTTLGSLG